MIQPNLGTGLADKVAERRRALAKVYSLLLKLAEESNDKKVGKDTETTEKTEAAGKLSGQEPEHLD